MHISDEEQDWEHSSEENSSLSDDAAEEDESPVTGQIKRKKSVETAPALKKVKYENITDEQNAKKSKNDLYRAPTVDELNELKETQHLYNNNLFRLQIEELVKEIKIKNKHLQHFTKWFASFEGFIDDLPKHKLQPSKIDDPKHKHFTLCDQEVSLECEKPESVNLFGLHKLNALPGPILQVNINVTMPRSCFNVKDYLNNRYFVKRYNYLAYLLHFINKKKIGLNAQWIYHEGNDLLPIIQFNPPDSPKILIKLFVTPSENYFKANRCLPDVNNVKSNVIEASNIDAELLKELPTPFYNSALAHDITLTENHKYFEEKLHDLPNIHEAIKLIQVWLNQRHLNEGFGSFTENLVLYSIVYLITKKKINKHMSSYQVVRNFWNFLKDTDLKASPISLCDETKHIEKFQQAFDVILLDVSGCYNVAAFLSAGVYEKVKLECEIAFNLLDEGGINAFHSLFIAKLPQYLQYDCILSLNNNGTFKKMLNNCTKQDRIKFYGYDKLVIMNGVKKMLEKGLNKRSKLIVPLFSAKNSMSSHLQLAFGINLDQSNAFHFLEMGPELNDPEEKQFRDFWGPLSSDRRFKDGSICVAVYFETKTIKERREIVAKIMDWIVGEKLNLKYKFHFNQLEEMIVNKNVSCSFPLGTNEECCLKVVAASDDLAKKLRGLEMPLSITGVQGVSDVYSFTEVFPPIPTNYRVGTTLTREFGNSIVFNDKIRITPKFVQPIECILHMEHTSKWPKDLQGIKKMTTAFYLQISKLLEKKHGIVSSVKPDFMDVCYLGYVFRYNLYVPRVIGLLKREVMENGVVSYKDSAESKEVEKQMIILPKLSSALKGIQSQYPSFGTSTCLIKRWLRAHLIDSWHFPDVVINLLNASLYTTQSAFLAATTPQVAFLRFLKFVAEFQFNIQAVVVNFNDEITKEALAEIDSKLLQKRESCPDLYLAMPYDNCESVLTRTSPTKQVLRRVKTLALETLSCFHSIIVDDECVQVGNLFVPNYDGFNVLIHLKPQMNPQRHEQVAASKELGVLKLEKYDEQSGKVPVTGFNPVKCYLRDLRANYSEYASFFHDSYGGCTIGVIWTPKALEEREFKVSNVGARRLVDGKLKTNFDGLIEDFYIVGKNIVKSIETK